MTTKLPVTLDNQHDLDIVFNYFFSEEVQATNIKHLRFGQFIFNLYGLEIDASYNQKDVYLVYGQLLNIINHIHSYKLVKDLLENKDFKLPQELNEQCLP